MDVTLVGAGAVGARAARQLALTPSVERLVVFDAVQDRAEAVARSLGDRVRLIGESELEDHVAADGPPGPVLLATPGGSHVELARLGIAAGRSVVSVSDDVDDVRGLLELDAEANEREVGMVVGAGFSPGLTCALAAFAGSRMDDVDEIHVAKFGTGGPACARQHHKALGGAAIEWRDGIWQERRPGSGRELCFFPDPVGGADCYLAALPEPILLVPAIEGLTRVSVRVAATRRDRLTGRLPMLRPPHPEGAIGGIRVEVRGRRGTARRTTVLGASERPAVAAAAVAVEALLWSAAERLRRFGAGGVASLVPPGPFVAAVCRERGVRIATFGGGHG